MRNLLVILLWPMLLTATNAAARPVVFVSIAPQAWFVENLAGDVVHVEVLVGPGQSPATYDPSIGRLRDLARADALLSIGVPMEDALLPGLEKSMPDLRIYPVHHDIELRMDDHDHDHGHGHGQYDRHIWLSPLLAKSIARNTCEALLHIIPADSLHLRRNLDTLLSDLDILAVELNETLTPVRGAVMAVFHPAYGYLTDAYGLQQVAIEDQGSAPSPRGLVRTLRRLRDEGVRAIFIQPQFSQQHALKIAEDLGLEVIVLDPLAADYADNMRNIAKTIASTCNTGGTHEH